LPSQPSQPNPRRREWTFADGDSPPPRLERFLQKNLPALSRRNLQDLIADNLVLVNQRAAEKGYRLRAGDRVEIRLPGSLEFLPVPAPSLPLTLIYQDQELVVLDKPGLVPAHPLSPFETGTIANALVARFPELSGVGAKPLEAGLIHRLDSGTSGILVAGRTPAARSQLKQDLARRLWNKKYLALVWGIIASDGVIKQDLAHHPGDRSRMMIVRDTRDPHRGRILPAETRFRILKRFQDVCLLEADLISGVTHQIRVHLAEAGHPVVGDPLYGPERTLSFDLAPGRFFLHAVAVELPHPVTREKLLFQSGLPEDLRRVLRSFVCK
jgi:23S rRNA pseudouridine1911/1915/1917 synthase